jgi:hypothetical protein
MTTQHDKLDDVYENTQYVNLGSDKINEGSLGG